jgi:hypothetical protein
MVAMLWYIYHFLKICKMNKGGYLKINSEVYAQWTDFNLVVGDNVFDIKGVDSIAPTVTNYQSGTVAITAEILKNSVTVDAGGEVGVYPKAISKTKFSIYAENAMTVTVSLQTKVVVGVDVIAPPTPLNIWTYNIGTATDTATFESAIGFTLINPTMDGTTIGFDNVGYHIADNAFNSNTDLLNIKTVANITAGNSCFEGCTALTSTGLIATAGFNCFADCTALSSTGLIATAGDSCFTGCTALTSTGLIATAGDGCFEGCTALTSTGLIASAGKSCFAGCTALTSTGLIATAEGRCFEGCTALTSTGLIATAGSDCFYGCTAFTNMDFSNCTNFGTATGYDSVFELITGLTINLKAKAIHQTSNNGAMEGDLQYLFDNNTVNTTWV